MKRIIAAAFLLTALTSCSAVEESLPESVENSVVDNSDDGKEFQDSLNEPSEVDNSNDDSEFQYSVNEPSEVDNSNDDSEFQYSVNEYGVDVKKAGRIVQTLECNYNLHYYNNENSEDFLIFRDFDFDGYDDLCIPLSSGTLYTNGTYYRFNPETSLYEKWDELNEIGRVMLTDEEAKVIKYGKNDGDYWLEYYNYIWQDGKPILFEHEVTETGDEWLTYAVDTDGNEAIITEELKYSVNEDSIDVIRNGKTVQSINFDTTELISFSERVSVDLEQFLVTSDFDFDGYDDLFIPERLGTPNIPGKYYRYNPDTGMYEEWEEFNKISTLVRIQQTNNALIEDITSSVVDYKETAWFWEGSVLKKKFQRIQKAVENNEIIIEDYKFDENDELMLTGTYKLGEEPPFCNN